MEHRIFERQTHLRNDDVPFIERFSMLQIARGGLEPPLKSDFKSSASTNWATAP